MILQMESCVSFGIPTVIAHIAGAADRHRAGAGASQEYFTSRSTLGYNPQIPTLNPEKPQEP